MLGQIGLLLPIIFPLIAAILVALPNIIPMKRIYAVSIGAVVINLVLLLMGLGSFVNQDVHIYRVNDFLDIFIHVDKMGLLFALMIGVLWLFTVIYSTEYMHHEKKQRRFFAFFLLTEGVALGIAFAGNLFTLYIFYELLTLSTFPLVIHAGSKQALDSGKKYIVYSFFGATFVLMGMLLLYSSVPSLAFHAGGVGMGLDDPTLLLVAYVSMFIGFGVKAALVPFHGWLPAAMVAPTPVSALLHAVAVVKSGIFALLRMSFFLFGPIAVQAIGATDFVYGIILLTVVMGSFLALHQINLKKRLAYSTISQLGYILLGIVLMNDRAFMGSIIHLLNHAVIKITLFFCVGAITHQTGIKDIRKISGIGKVMPVTMMCFSIAAVSLVGIPPSNGFVSKWFLGTGALQSDSVLSILVLLLSAFLTAGYLLPIIVGSFFTKPADALAAQDNLDPPPKMLAPIVVLTAIILILGIFPNPIIGFIESISVDIFQGVN